MDLTAKLQILAQAARYDASCASSGSSRKGAGLGNTSMGGICHSWSEDGRCISLLKVLLTNHCVFDCAYCVNRRSNDIARAAFTEEQVVELTIGFYRRNYIEGLFLSSGVMCSPDHTMEKMIRIALLLRTRHGFGGYIHLKAIPGASPDLIRQAGLYADRLSVNIELPSEKALTSLAPEKSKAGILQPMGLIARHIRECREEKRLPARRQPPPFAPAGQSTQMIIGASPERDRQILLLSESLYRKFSLKRVYYSAYVPVGAVALVPPGQRAPLVREHRLYQADWLVRFYGFSAAEILDPGEPDLAEEVDPKAAWALRHPQHFPLDVNRADYEWLLRVPGIGVQSAKKIVSSRRFAALRLEDLERLGVVLKRARYFINCAGKTADPLPVAAGAGTGAGVLNPLADSVSRLAARRRKGLLNDPRQPLLFENFA